jgi:hypothetical protein
MIWRTFVGFCILLTIAGAALLYATFITLLEMWGVMWVLPAFSALALLFVFCHWIGSSYLKS